MSLEELRKLPLHGLRTDTQPSSPAKAGAGVTSDATLAALSRRNLQLCFTTRSQVQRLRDMELELLRSSKPLGRHYGSIAPVKGCNGCS